MKINQGNTHHIFSCKRCVAVFRKQKYLDEHMEIVHKVVLDETLTKQCLLCGGPIVGRISSAKFCSSTCSGRFHHSKAMREK